MTTTAPQCADDIHLPSVCRPDCHHPVRHMATVTSSRPQIEVGDFVRYTGGSERAILGNPWEVAEFTPAGVVIENVWGRMTCRRTSLVRATEI